MITDKDLILQTIEGNNSAFEELVRRHDRRVLSIAYNYINSPEDAKDIYQEVFIRVYNGLPGFEFRSEFSTWLHKITVNVCLSFRQKKLAHNLISINENDDFNDPLIETLQGGSRTDEAILHDELLSFIRKEIEALPEKQRMIFNLKYFHEYKLKEIAGMMQTTEGTVKKLLSIAIHKLRDGIKSNFDIPHKK
jgi:RNA polymerase sigma-70 factor, ECF subfamily